MQKKNITDSIIYAQRIQNAILPPIDLVNQLVPNNFIYYKPKDIVSGDFYWVEKIDDKAVVAAVDCTGHGVPGAFMSIIGANLLNYAVRERKAKHTNEILDILNEEISLSIHKENGRNIIRDGMDIAICIVDYKNQTLEFSGAYNPLYMVRNNELTEIRADRFAIGSFKDKPELKYTCQIVNMQPNDAFYIFSDGYADQFGGPRNRKFMYKNFKTILANNAHKTTEAQLNTIDEEYLKWRGTENQVDDIIIIGFKI